MRDPGPGQLEILADRECVELLQSHDLGRIALVDQQVHPLIFPVNYFSDEGAIAFSRACFAPNSRPGLRRGAAA